MKRYLLITMLLALGCCLASAQKNLHIAPLFKSSGPYSNGAKEVWVEGRELKAYKLTLYRSLTYERTDAADNHFDQLTADIETWVKADSHDAYSKEMGNLGGHLYYAFLALPPEQSKSACRYIIYRNASLREGGKQEVTIIYMEGNTSISELKKMFKKNS